MALVAGVDSSTQSVKVVVRDADSGELVSQATRSHPVGTEVDPYKWRQALESALDELSNTRIDAISIAGQQHGMVALDAEGSVIRDALLWNDTRSARAAADLNEEFPDIHLRTGSKLVASFTASKVRWLADSEPANAKKVSAIALPHDWLSWQLTGSRKVTDIFTDRSDASGTGYFDSKTNEYDSEIFASAIRNVREVHLPKLIATSAFAATTKSGTPIAAGAGDNAAAALGLGAKVGDLIISLGTSGTAFAVSPTSTHDESGEVAGFADATGNFLPLACTLNAAKVLDTISKLLNVDLQTFSSLALKSESGAGGLRLLPHFDGERTPNRPTATGNLIGISHSNFTSENVARAAIEGVMSGMLYAARAVTRQGFEAQRILLIGGAARSEAVQQIAAEIFGTTILVPPHGEYVADGAARQAAWALSGKPTFPEWNVGDLVRIEPIQKSDVADSYLELIGSL